MASLKFSPAKPTHDTTLPQSTFGPKAFFYSDKDRHPSGELIGGKALNLAKMNSWEVPVPRWFCITSQVFEEFKLEMPQVLLNELEQLAQLTRKTQTDFNAQTLTSHRIAEASEELMAWIHDSKNFQQSAFERNNSFIKNFTEKVTEHFGRQSSKRFAVRSSAIGEDSGGNSFAGQFDTFLYVDESELFDKVLGCFASAFGPRVLSYLMSKNIPFENLKMAVVVQEMWHSQKAGVLFTCSPDGRLEEISVAAGYGLGEGIVSDRVETDLYRIARQSPEARHIGPLQEGRNLKSTVNRKTEAIVFDVGSKSGTKLSPVAEDLQTKPVLSHTELHELAQICLRIEELAGCPQDIEWGFDASGTLALLQTRPITTLPKGKLSLCDNSNVSESYPGVSSTLTFSVVKRLYAEIFERFTLSTGTKVSPQHRSEVFDHLVIHVQGRIYYNLSNWYTVLKMIPGTGRFVAVWEEMLGIQPSKPTAASRLRSVISFVKGTRTYLSVLRHYIKLDAEMQRIHVRFTKMLQEFRGIDLARLSLNELAELHEQMIQKILRGWEITLWNDAFTFIFAGVSKFALGKLGADDPATLLHDLLSGEAQTDTVAMESANSVLSVQKLSLALGKLVEEQRGRVQLGKWLDDCPLFFSQPAFANDPDCGLFKDMFDKHLDRYGDRTMNELKLETRTFRQQPEALLQLIASLAENKESFKSVRFQGDLDDRYQRAQKRLENLYQTKRFGMGYRHALKFLIHNARKCMRHRENSRFDRARAYGVSRSIIDEIGRQLKEQGALPTTEAVYLLGFEALRHHIVGDTKLNHETVLQAQQTHATWENQNPEDRFYIRGKNVGVNPVPQKSTGMELPLHTKTPAGLTLKGTGSSPGEASAEAIVLENPELGLDVRGKILVTRMTDPGWVFLMVNCVGLVSEKGSILSHTAIIGRELGIPTVVGVQNATKLIPSGSQLRLNGTTGEATLLETVS